MKTLHRMFTMLSLFVLTLSLNSACGYSPLLNHVYPNRSPESIAIESDEPMLQCRIQFQNGQYCADFKWLLEPHGSDEGSMKVYLWPKSQPGVLTTPENFSLGVKLWMPDMGHGSQKVKVNASRNSVGQILPGIFDATEIMFVMGGDWEIQFQWKDASGTFLEIQTIPYVAQ